MTFVISKHVIIAKTDGRITVRSHERLCLGVGDWTDGRRMWPWPTAFRVRHLVQMRIELDLESSPIISIDSSVSVMNALC